MTCKDIQDKADHQWVAANFHLLYDHSRYGTQFSRGSPTPQPWRPPSTTSSTNCSTRTRMAEWVRLGDPDMLLLLREGVWVADGITSASSTAINKKALDIIDMFRLLLKDIGRYHQQTIAAAKTGPARECQANDVKVLLPPVGKFAVTPRNRSTAPSSALISTLTTTLDKINASAWETDVTGDSGGECRKFVCPPGQTCQACSLFF
jgi:hypothetical protein